MSFHPDLILISAGFDAHQDDPLANLRLVEADFAWATDQIARSRASRLADAWCRCWRAGYNLAALARSTAVHVKSLMDAGSLSPGRM